MKTITTLQGYAKAGGLIHGWQRVINTLPTMRGYVSSEDSQAGRTVGGYSGDDFLQGTQALNTTHISTGAVVAKWQQANAPPHSSNAIERSAVP